MNSFTALFAVTMVTLVVAEPPSPYSYNRPSTGLGGSSFGSSGFGGSSFGGSSFGGSSGGFQSNEGANVDPQLLEQVRQILLREESQSSSFSAPSSQYGVPSGPSGRVVGILLENTIPSIQVASFSQQSAAPSSGGYSYSPAPAPAQVYSAPQQSYSAPQQSYSAPQQSYSAPQQSYSAPSISAPSSSYGTPSAPSSQYGAPF
ncbi:uncharacterized protein LOC129570474 [Sitodiplosis mosellana]|uniref:uncharacterized protein LOC129570474 n=1 Tax=Sitodiplosis mosellana TaxID=263140 RepID=UPI002444AA56|nr:uncharacterized protein LOC129570474 [Sitodiplosis mosellana]